MTILRYKFPHLEAELALADPRLLVLVLYAAGMSVNRGWAVSHLTVTSVRRQHLQGSPLSVHEVLPCRGCDVRALGVLTEAEALALEANVNLEFDYSPLPTGTEQLKACWYETQDRALERGRDPNLPAIVSHLHFQVPEWRGVGRPMVNLYPSTVIA